MALVGDIDDRPGLPFDGRFTQHTPHRQIVDVRERLRIFGRLARREEREEGLHAHGAGGFIQLGPTGVGALSLLDMDIVGAGKPP